MLACDMNADLDKASVPIIDGQEGIARAVGVLADGALVGIPTETVYGLAADASNAEAIARVFAAKGRPSFNPLIAHVASLDAAREEGEFDERAVALAEAFWPGPLTLVVPAATNGRTSELARAGLSTIGLRVPAHPVARQLLDQFGGPLAAPSANPSGRISPTTASDVADAFGDEIAFVLDGGRCPAGVESTILSVMPGEPIMLLRPGAIERARLEAVVGELAAQRGEGITAPGQLSSHYAPTAAVRLNAHEAGEGEVLLAFGPDAPPDALNLSATGDLVEAAANLYAQLRALDSSGARTIAVMPVPETGLGEAINDRLRRAAAPRIKQTYR